MTKNITIGNDKISELNRPYVIAELSANHNGSLERATMILKAASQAGANAFKLQTFTADTMTLDCDNAEFIIKSGLWSGKKLYDLYQDAHMPWEWHTELFAVGKEHGITVFSSAFDFSAIELLEKLDAPAYKVASFEAMDLPLLEAVAQTGKPIIISTGVINKAQISEALEVIYKNSNSQVVLLHCVSDYPAKPEQFNLKTIPDMAREFRVPVGLSDHSINNDMSVAAIGLGACIFEKHITLRRSDGGLDSDFSLEPPEFSELVAKVNNAWFAMGEADYTNSSPRDNYRSLYFVKAVQKGSVITENDIKSIRPGMGLSPKYYYDVLGKKAATNIDPCMPVAWGLLTD